MHRYCLETLRPKATEYASILTWLKIEFITTEVVCQMPCISVQAMV